LLLPGCISLILRPSAVAFLPEQVFPTDHQYSETVDLHCYPVAPGFLELNAVNSGQTIDSSRGYPICKTMPGLEKSCCSRSDPILLTLFLAIRSHFAYGARQESSGSLATQLAFTLPGNGYVRDI
jgi:hypothetical protein